MKQKLLNSFRLRAVMFVAMMCAAFTGAWADSKTETIDFSEKGYENGVQYTTTTQGDVTVTFAGSANDGKYYTTGEGMRIYGGGSATFTANDKTITYVKLVFASGYAPESGKQNDVWSQEDKTTCSTSAYNDCWWEGSSESVSITRPSGSGHWRLQQVEVTYEDGGGDTSVEKEDCDLALTGAPIALTFDMYDNTDAQVINYTSSSTGAVTVETSEYVSTVVGDGTITVTPLKKTSEAVEITVSQTADDDYNAGSATFTVTIADSTPKTGGWYATNLADLTEDDVFVIVGDNGNAYAMSNNNGTGSAPSAVAVTIENDELTSDVADNIKWNISGNATAGYTFYPAGSTETWLYCTATNNGVRVGTNDNKAFRISTDGYLYHIGTSRYVGVYNSQDWRCYTSINNNIKDQTFTFYKYEDSSDTRTATTTTIDATGITNNNVFDGTAAGQLTATVAAGDATIDNADITWSGNNDAVATIASDGTVTLVAAGEVTFTATYAGDEENYKASSATYKLTVTNTDPNAPGTENNPYTVAQAIEATPESGTSDNVYIRGIVSAFYNTSITGDGSNYRYYISDDGTTTDQLLVYRGKGLDNVAFSNEDDLQIGDEVVILGGLTTYQNAPEVAANNYIVSLNRVEKQEAGLAFGETTAFTVTLGDNFTAPTLINPNQLEDIVFISDNTEVATVNPGTGAVEIVGVGEATITVSFRGDDTYKAGSASYTITVESGLNDNDLTITAPESTTLTVGDELQLTYTTSADGELTWESSNDAVLTVDEEGTVTAVAAGTATITLTQAASNTYDGAEASIEFTVKKAAPAGTEVDELTRETTGVTGTSYTEWSGKSVSSDAVYAGNSAGGNESIQLRSNNNNSGIVSTTSGGSIFSVEVAWNENTSAGRTLNVYGSNTAYVSAADLYDSAKQGTLLGTIVCGTSTSLEVEGDYEYVGVRSASGAMYLTSVTFTWATSGKASAGFSFGETTAFNLLPNAEFTAPTLTTAENFDGTVVYSSSDEDIALVDESTGEVLIGAKEGTATITASSEATENFKAGSASYTITVKAPEKAENGLAYETTSVEANIGEAFTAPTLTNPNQLTVTYSSDNEELATVDENTGEVVIGETVGNVTITATFAGNDEFKAGSVSYIINIIDPNNQPTYYALVAEYYGKYYAVDGSSFNSGAYGAVEVDAVNGKVITAATDEISFDLITFTNVGYIKSKSTSKYIGYGSGTNLTQAETSYSWTIDKDNSSWKNGDNGTRSVVYRGSDNVFKAFATSNINDNNGTYATSYTQAYTFADGYVRSDITSTWGTICLPYAVEAADVAGAKFYSIAGKKLDAEGAPTSLILEEETNGLEAGVPYIFEMNEGATKIVAAYNGEEATEAANSNGLIGSFSGTEVVQDMYILSNNEVKLCGTGCSIAANRAYINLAEVSVYNAEPAAGVKMLVLTDLPTGINAVNAAHNGAAIYNMAGQRVGKTTKGLYIVNGQKVVVK